MNTFVLLITILFLIVIQRLIRHSFTKSVGVVPVFIALITIYILNKGAIDSFILGLLSKK